VTRSLPPSLGITDVKLTLRSILVHDATADGFVEPQLDEDDRERARRQTELETASGYLGRAVAGVEGARLEGLTLRTDAGTTVVEAVVRSPRPLPQAAVERWRLDLSDLLAVDVTLRVDHRLGEVLEATPSTLIR
jgi:hypothetical protein